MTASSIPTKVDSDAINHEVLKRSFSRQLTEINDLYIETQTVIRALSQFREEVKSRKDNGQTHYRVRAPSRTDPNRTIRRQISNMLSIIDARAGSKEYVQALLFAVAKAESYLNFSLEVVLRAYPAKLLLSAKGNAKKSDEDVPVDLRDVIASSDLNDFLARRAVIKVREASYAAPKQMFSYCSKVFGFEIDSGYLEEYIEIKATRDIFVHGNGIVNSIYLQKAADKARAALDEKLIVDSQYLDASVVCIKNVMSQIHRGLQWKFGKSVELQRVLASGQR